MTTAILSSCATFESLFGEPATETPSRCHQASSRKRRSCWVLPPEALIRLEALRPSLRIRLVPVFCPRGRYHRRVAASRRDVKVNRAGQPALEGPGLAICAMISRARLAIIDIGLSGFGVSCLIAARADRLYRAREFRATACAFSRQSRHQARPASPGRCRSARLIGPTRSSCSAWLRYRFRTAA